MVQGKPALAVTAALMTGSTSVADMFGGSPQRTLRLQVVNTGDAVATTPRLMVEVGRVGKALPVYAASAFASLEPGATTTLEIPIGLGFGAIGTYQISGQIGDAEAGQFSLTWESYPWGLILLNVVGAALLGAALYWRLRRRQQGPAVAAAVGGPEGPRDDEAVVDLETLERWWAGEALAAPALVGAGAGASVEAESALAVVDIDAAERWLERRPSRPVSRM